MAGFLLASIAGWKPALAVSPATSAAVTLKHVAETMTIAALAGAATLFDIFDRRQPETLIAAPVTPRDRTNAEYL